MQGTHINGRVAVRVCRTHVARLLVDSHIGRLAARHIDRLTPKQSKARGCELRRVRRAAQRRMHLGRVVLHGNVACGESAGHALTSCSR